MKKPKGLRTLGDYRRAAKDLLFRSTLPTLSTKSKSTSPYDAVKTALGCTEQLIIFSRTTTLSPDPSEDPWEPTWFGDSEYRMKNLQLFYAVKLMEFAVTYKEVQSTQELHPGWSERPDEDIRMFTSPGLSYLEVGFNFVHEWGRDIIGILQNSYREYRKEGNIIYADPFKFLRKTPTVDDLKINPVPDIIIKTWFDEIVKGTKRWIEENDLSKSKLEAEFNRIRRQLEHEWNVWKKRQSPDSQEAGYTKALQQKQWAEILGLSTRTLFRIRQKDEKDQSYHFKSVTARRWSLPINEIPAELFEKYKARLVPFLVSHSKSQ